MDIGDVDVLSVAGTVTIGGVAAENAAVSGNPVLVGGRYDSTPRTLGDGDAGAFAIDVNGHTITSPHATALVLADNVSNTVNLQVDEAEAFMGEANFGYYFDGTAWDRMRGDATNGMLVNLGANNDIDVTDIIPGVGATNLGKAEDAVHSSGDVGVMALGVRNDALAALAGTDGDYAPLQVSDNGALWTDVPDAVADTNNSTTTPINANIDYTGTGTDVSPYSGITVSIFADEDSDANGMRFQFSSDGTNWDIEVDGGFDYLADTGRTFQFGILAKYFRVIFQNAGTNQTAFRLQTLLHHHSISLTTIHRVDDNLSPDRSCTVVKSVLMAQAAGSGDFIPIDSTAGGNLKVAVEEFDASLPTGSNLIGDVGLSGARTSGGVTPYKNIDVDAKDEVKATAGQVYWIHAMNTTDAPVFLKFYDLAAASVTVGTTVPDFTFMVPANADSDGAGFTLTIPNGIAFGTGITIAGTGLVADNDNTALDGNALLVNLGFA